MIVIWKRDRLGRNLRDLLVFVSDLEGDGIEFVSLTVQIPVVRLPLGGQVVVSILLVNHQGRPFGLLALDSVGHDALNEVLLRKEEEQQHRQHHEKGSRHQEVPPLDAVAAVSLEDPQA